MSNPDQPPESPTPTVPESAPIEESLAADICGSLSLQLVGGFLLAVLAPGFIRWRLEPSPYATGGLSQLMRDSSLINAVLGSAAAMFLGYVAMRQIKAHPGVRSIGYVLYSFIASYGALGLAFLFVRADYSRYQLLASFVLAVTWFALLDQVAMRKTVWRLAVAPCVAASALPVVARVQWQAVGDPAQTIRRMGGLVADFRAPHAPEWERFFARCALDGLPVYDIRQVTEWLTGKVRVETLAENTLSSGLARAVYARLKRLVDLAGVIVAAPIFIPVIAAAAVAIRLESPGPALFAQARMGHRGRTFTMYKLRSMHAGGDKSGQDFTSENDPRVTRVGAVIRRFRIDEFPQIWNILMGQMSWIGPRPEAVSLAEWYEREVPFYCYRHMVRPGVTGWAQVNQGNVAMVAAATEKLHYDFYYIKNISPWLDFLIAAKSIRTIALGIGSR